MEYIKKFNTHTDYNTYITGSDKKLPNLSYCKDVGDIHLNDIDYSEQYLTFTALEDGTFSCAKKLLYSIDNGKTWTSLPANSSTPTITQNTNILWKSNYNYSSSNYSSPNYYGAPETPTPNNFKSSGNFEVKGNLMSFISGDNFKTPRDLSDSQYMFYEVFLNCTKLISAEHLIFPTTVGLSCYNSMFINCTSLIKAPTKLPATTLEYGCYGSMFSGCTSLVNAPELPATTLADSCYESMFHGCSSLTTAPTLPATTLASSCYYQMFLNCTSLNKAPELPTTTLERGCYQYMFHGCTSLTTAPELPATTLASGCYMYMFQNCTSLTTAPELPATTLASACYSHMFENCTSLTTAPELPATTLVTNCYMYMFSGCSSLNYIKAMFITANNTYTNCWVQNVSATGTFVKNSAAEWTGTGWHNIPTGWTVQTASE